MLDWLYPWVCSLCGHASGNGSALCDHCHRKLPRVQKPVCLYCGASARADEAAEGRCSNCAKRERAFDFARSALCDTPDAHRLILDLKYRKAAYLAPALASFLDELWEECALLRAWNDWTLMPVPATARRLAQRGYNQAEELARALGKRRRLPLAQALRRVSGDRVSQTKLAAGEREEHARSIYSLTRKTQNSTAPLPPHILLIDDVFTTGATLRACARQLKTRPEVRVVGALTVLRIDKDNPALRN